MLPQEKAVMEPVPLTRVVWRKLIKYSSGALAYFRFLKKTNK